MPVNESQAKPPAAHRTRAHVGLLFCAALIGCGPIVKVPAFRQRPDSVRPASVLGTFEGRVVDADTQEPIESALVWCSWGFVRGVGDAAPEAVRTAETLTDPDGRYAIPQLRHFPSGLSTRLARFSLVIYRKGYVAYRHNRVFGRGMARADFSQLANTVKLVRWSPEMSHAEHLLFIGGGASLRRASTWEAALAVAQLEGQRARLPLGGVQALDVRPTTAPSARPVGEAEKLLSSDDVRAITGYAGVFSQSPLEAPGDATSTLHLRAVDHPERYDVAIRLWRLADDALESRYDTLLAALPGAKQTDQLGDRSFVVWQGEIGGVGILARGAGVVLLTCGRGQCTEDAQLEKLARKVEQKLKRLPLAPQTEEEP